MPPQFDILKWIACSGVAAPVALFTWWLLAALRTDELQQSDQWRYDVSRINDLRRHDGLYRAFQPVIQFFAKLNRTAFASSLPQMKREILAAGLPRTWLPEEYLARMQWIALLCFPLYLWLCISMFRSEGAMLAAIITGLHAWLLRRRLSQQARSRLILIKRRLPFMLDLMTLLMEAGASFLQSLEQAVREYQGHPAATEFGRVLGDMNMGKSRLEAFDNMRQRLDDDEITAIVGAILQSERLGTPLARIFRTQADVLQVKRSQRAETIANEAGVNMLLPGILVMASTVLIILGPFLLNYLYFGLSI